MACLVDAALPSKWLGDPGRIRQVLVNLTANAIKFTEKGSVTISVKPINEITGENLRFEIKDTGIGIPEETQQKLFRPFYSGRQLNHPPIRRNRAWTRDIAGNC